MKSRGLKPDIPVLPAEGENARALATRILDEAFADLKRTPAVVREIHAFVTGLPSKN
jgi:hypothetical protein